MYIVTNIFTLEKVQSHERFKPLLEHLVIYI